MGIFNKVVYSKIDVFVEFERAIILEIKGQTKIKNLFLLFGSQGSHICTHYTNNCCDHHYTWYMYMCLLVEKCEDVHCSFNFIFLNQLCEKKQDITLS